MGLRENVAAHPLVIVLITYNLDQLNVIYTFTIMAARYDGVKSALVPTWILHRLEIAERLIPVGKTKPISV